MTVDSAGTETPNVSMFTLVIVSSKRRRFLISGFALKTESNWTCGPKRYGILYVLSLDLYTHVQFPSWESNHRSRSWNLNPHILRELEEHITVPVSSVPSTFRCGSTPPTSFLRTGVPCAISFQVPSTTDYPSRSSYTLVRWKHNKGCPPLLSTVQVR